jgi:hypothetical protein
MGAVTYTICIGEKADTCYDDDPHPLPSSSAFKPTDDVGMSLSGLFLRLATHAWLSFCIHGSSLYGAGSPDIPSMGRFAVPEQLSEDIA